MCINNLNQQFHNLDKFILKPVIEKVLTPQLCILIGEHPSVGTENIKMSHKPTTK